MAKAFIKSFPIPHQHGGWAMFLIPAVMAKSRVDSWTVFFLLIFSFTLIFLSHRPFARLLRRWKFRRKFELESFYWSLILGGTGMVFLGGYFIYHQLWQAIWLSLIVGIIFVIHLNKVNKKEGMTIPAELIGVIGLTASAPLTYIVGQSELDAQGWVMWLVNFLYFSGSIFYIKLKLRIQPNTDEPDFFTKIRHGKKVLIHSAITMFLLLIITFVREYTWLFFLAFIPYFLKSWSGVIRWTPKSKAKVTKFGILETVHSIFFAIVTLFGFQIPYR